MYDYIKGKIARKGENYAVVEANGIGYRIVTSLRSTECEQDDVTFYTHLHVREDIMELYGFTTIEERSSFEMLISISGVGPKAAVSVLSAMSPSALALAVIGGDAKAISRAQGVGPKLAQRIILELKDKVKDIEVKDLGEVYVETDSEAVSALIVLGYSAQEAKSAVSSAGQGTTEEVIKKALVNLMR